MSDLKDLKNLVTRATKLKKKIDKAKLEVAKEVAEKIAGRIEENYASSDIKSNEPCTVIPPKRTQTGYIVEVQGSQVIYTEFGTGTTGERSPHENKKSEFGLNPYNYATIENGGTIRKNPNKDTNASKAGIPVGELYWTYQGKYTQGIPAGKQIYNAVEDTKKELGEITKRKVADVLSKH